MNTLDSHDTSATVTDRRAARSVTRSAGSVLGALLGLILTTASVSTSAQPVMDNPEAGQPTADTRPLPINEVRMFAEALEAIRSAYVQEIDDQTLIEYAIRGMLAGLDPHSAYLNANR